MPCGLSYCVLLLGQRVLPPGSKTLTIAFSRKRIHHPSRHPAAWVSGPAVLIPPPVCTTSTRSNIYKALKLMSKTHFYGRAAPEEVLATYLSGLLRARSARRGFSEVPVCSRNPNHCRMYERRARRPSATRDSPPAWRAANRLSWSDSWSDSEPWVCIHWGASARRCCSLLVKF